MRHIVGVFALALVACGTAQTTAQGAWVSNPGYVLGDPSLPLRLLLSDNDGRVSGRLTFGGPDKPDVVTLTGVRTDQTLALIAEQDGRQRELDGHLRGDTLVLYYGPDTLIFGRQVAR